MDLNSLALSNEILKEIDIHGSEFYKFIKDLLKDKQEGFINHLLSHQTTPGERKEFLEFYINFNKSYTGGLEAYLKKAHYLLHESTPSKTNGKIQKANGHKLHFNTPQFNQMEKKGIETLPQLAFILVAGGLGERLGHSDIKLNLPVDPFTKQTYLQFYCQNIRALQSTICKEFNKAHRIPLAIMVSNKTHKATQQALELNHYFGLDKEQVTLLIQEYVPCFSNKKGDLAYQAEKPSKIICKPHGHGDIHSLIYKNNLCKKWMSQKIDWLFFFQDTNPLIFKSLFAHLGVSMSENLDLNFMVTPRKSGDQVGVIANQINPESQTSQLVNIEYNQLSTVLESSNDLSSGDINDPKTGYSPYPGNMNQFIVKLRPYEKILNKNLGLLKEFINPKYDSHKKDQFKSPARLETMMQDIALDFDSNQKTSYTMIDCLTVFSPIKQNTKDALLRTKKGLAPFHILSSQEDLYQTNQSQLKHHGVQIEEPTLFPSTTFPVRKGPYVIIDPQVLLTRSYLKKVFPAPEKVIVKKNSLLIIKSHQIKVTELFLEGALIIESHPDALVHVKKLIVKNKGWIPQNPFSKKGPEQLKEAHLSFEKKGNLIFSIKDPGSYVIDENGLSKVD